MSRRSSTWKSLEGLRQLLGPAFVIEESTTYSGAFSELIDTAVNGLYLKMQQRQSLGGSSSKGTMITESDMRKHRKQFVLLSALYPLIWGVAKLDALLLFTPGYKLIVSARRVSNAGGPAAGRDPQESMTKDNAPPAPQS